MKPVVEYDIDPSGTISLSWNRSGHLLASHQNGSLSCYDVYQQKVILMDHHLHSLDILSFDFKFTITLQTITCTV
jgi:hypothetical protein